MKWEIYTFVVDFTGFCSSFVHESESTTTKKRRKKMSKNKMVLFENGAHQSIHKQHQYMLQCITIFFGA